VSGCRLAGGWDARSCETPVDMRRHRARGGSRPGLVRDVDRLVELAADLPVERVPLATISEIDTNYWFHGIDEAPTVRRIVDHIRLVTEVDMSYPIILGHDGRVMDGMHRIARALLDGRHEIAAVRFPEPLEPDYRNCQPDELPY
jgi:hypothetical protein